MVNTPVYKFDEKIKQNDTNVNVLEFISKFLRDLQQRINVSLCKKITFLLISNYSNTQIDFFQVPIPVFKKLA